MRYITDCMKVFEVGSGLMMFLKASCNVLIHIYITDIENCQMNIFCTSSRFVMRKWVKWQITILLTCHVVLGIWKFFQMHTTCQVAIGYAVKPLGRSLNIMLDIKYGLFPFVSFHSFVAVWICNVKSRNTLWRHIVWISLGYFPEIKQKYC